MNAVFGFERKVAKWDALDPHLQSYAQMASAAAIGCTLVHGLRLLPRPQRRASTRPRCARCRAGASPTSSRPVERDVLEYAEAMSVTPPTVDDALSTRLQEALGVKAVVELTQLVALENMRSRFNSAAGARGAGLLAGVRAAPRRTLASVSDRRSGASGCRVRRRVLDPATARRVRRRPDAAEFEALRPLLFTVAYEMLEVAADAEDVVQEAWLRWSRVDRVDRARRARLPRARRHPAGAQPAAHPSRRRRESYVGPWLPEPLLTAPDVADDVELAESVSTAMLLVLQTLTPLERAVFVLREVFDVPYDEIAEGVDRTPAAVRQIAHRAREHVAARRPRQRVDRAEHAAVLERSGPRAATGDIGALVDVLAPDVLLVTDGGGAAQGGPAADPSAGTRCSASSRPSPRPTSVVDCAGRPGRWAAGLVAVVDGVVDSVITIDAVDGRRRLAVLRAQPRQADAASSARCAWRADAARHPPVVGSAGAHRQPAAVDDGDPLRDRRG